MAHITDSCSNELQGAPVHAITNDFGVSQPEGALARKAYGAAHVCGGLCLATVERGTTAKAVRAQQKAPSAPKSCQPSQRPGK